MDTNKKNMTDEERLALAAKLDRELDEFIDGLEKRRYTDGWPEDRWEEEMDKHPFFMKTPPKEGDELHPLMEGMQQLKYDPEENTKEDLANTYKEDGNFYIKHKKYRMAIFSYTEGLNQKCENVEVNAMLYNNRSAAHFFLQNYRSSIGDATKALKLDQNYSKARFRLANCYYNLNKYDDCISTCDSILQLSPSDQPALDLRKKAQQSKSNKIRDERKQNAIERKKQNELNKLIQVIQSRNIRFEEQHGRTAVTSELLEPQVSPLEEYPVHLDENDGLVWPAAFCYPEFLFSDFQQQLSEDVVMYDILRDMFAEPLECDKNHKYKPDTLNVYFENHNTGTTHKIDVDSTIRNIVGHKDFVVRGGCLMFFVVPKDSEVEREYVNKPKRSFLNL